MENRPAVGRGLRVVALAAILCGVLVGGIQVALQIEDDLAFVAVHSYKPKASSSGMFEFFACSRATTPPVEPCGLLALPFLLASFLPVRRLITLHLRD